MPSCWGDPKGIASMGIQEPGRLLQGAVRGMKQRGFPRVKEPAALPGPQDGRDPPVPLLPPRAALRGASGSPYRWKNLHIRSGWGYVSRAEPSQTAPREPRPGSPMLRPVPGGCALHQAPPGPGGTHAANPSANGGEPAVQPQSRVTPGAVSPHPPRNSPLRRSATPHDTTRSPAGTRAARCQGDSRPR